MKFTAFTTESRTLFNSRGSVLQAMAYLWIAQWFDIICGATCFIRATKLDRCWIIAGAPSVHTDPTLFHAIEFSRRNPLIGSKTSLALVLSFISWQNKNWSRIAFSLTNLTYATNWFIDLISVVLSNWRLILPGLSWIWAISWLKMLCAISEIFLFTVLWDKGTEPILLASFRPSNICAIFTALGSISFSPTLWGAFAIIKETSY